MQPMHFLNQSPRNRHALRALIAGALLSFGLNSFAQTAESSTPSTAPTETVETAPQAPEQLTEAEIQAKIAEIMKALNPQTGDITLLGGKIKLSLGDKYYFLDAAASQRVLVELWGNPDTGTPVLGMIFPKQFTPLDDNAWGATLEYAEEGYVSDEEAAKIDYDDLLKNMQEATREASAARVKAGYGSVDLVGWAEPPHYDATSNKLYWAKNIKFDGAPSNTLNYNIRVLGRQGYLEVNFIADISQLADINASREAVLALTEFTPGNRYEDFDASTDNVASYGIAALVAGAAAKKAGLLAGLFLILKKFGVFIVVGIGALLSRFFKRNQ